MEVPSRRNTVNQNGFSLLRIFMSIPGYVFFAAGGGFFSIVLSSTLKSSNLLTGEAHDAAVLAQAFFVVGLLVALSFIAWEGKPQADLLPAGADEA
jgi:hypothetical protein